jgi:TolB-like protein/DNA-binding winged helix-turn-helix (wHTH) protein/Flp pilus assembly protein TadD
MTAAANGTMRYRVDDLIVDTGRCCVERDGVEIPLPRLSYELLLALVQAAPNLVMIDELNTKVWPGIVVSPETISQRIKLLRAALGDPAATPRYVGTVRGRGYRLLVPVVTVPALVPDDATKSDEASSDATSSAATRARPIRPAMRWAGLAVAVVLAAALGWLATRDHGSPASAPRARGAARVDPSIAVLPLVNRSPRPEDAVFAEGVHDDILTRLTQVGGIRVIARTSVERFRATTLDIREIGERLDVATVLEGSVQREGNRVRVNLQLIDAANGAHLWARNYDRELTAGNLFSLQSEVAQSVALELRPMLDSVERARLRVAPTASLEAWQDYQAGRRLLAGGRGSAGPEAQVLFERAIARDPDFALAHAGRADALALRATVRGRRNPALIADAATSIERALQLAPDDAEVLTVSAVIASDRGDVARAERELQRALELSPSNALATSYYGDVLAGLGRPREALRQFEAAARLDPYSIDTLMGLGGLLQDVGRPDEGLKSLLRVLEIDPARADAHVLIGVLFARSYGRLDLGLPWLERAASLDPSDVGAMDWLIILNLDLGRLEEARRWRLEYQRKLDDRLDARLDGWNFLVADPEDDPAVVAELARQALVVDPHDAWALALLVEADFAAQRPEQARRRYERAHPEWAGATALDWREDTFLTVLGYAETLRQTGDSARAGLIAAAVERYVREVPRLSPNGYYLADVGAHAVRNDKDAALDALEAAEREGWRGPGWRYARDRAPALSTIRGLPRFDAVFQRIERDMDVQRRRLEARAPDEPLPTRPP